MGGTMKSRFLGSAILCGLMAFGTSVLAQDNSSQYPQSQPSNSNTQQQPNYPNQNQNYPQQQTSPSQPYPNPTTTNQNPNYPNQNPNYPNQNQNYPNQNYPNQQTGVNGPNGNMGPGVMLPAGTQVAVRTNQNINSKQSQPGQTFDAEIENNIMDQSGNIIIPKGSQAQLALVSTKAMLGKEGYGLALQSVNVNGRQMMLQSNTVNGGGNKGGIGANKRTGEYVGGGALIGTVLGAVVGGGKGAAIGAVLGGAGGAGTQVLTGGSQVNVPAETLLNFKLDQPVTLQ
jgi:hypothetical protein